MSYRLMTTVQLPRCRVIPILRAARMILNGGIFEEGHFCALAVSPSGFQPEILALKHESRILGQWYLVQGRAKPVLCGPNSTESNLFHHWETTNRVGWMSENPTLVLNSNELCFQPSIASPVSPFAAHFMARVEEEIFRTFGDDAERPVTWSFLSVESPRVYSAKWTYCLMTTIA